MATANARFRRFINATQLMVFSNNMEYDDGSPQPIEGAFYASPSYDAPSFNYFREEEELNLSDLLADEDDALENEVLRDNNLNVIKHILFRFNVENAEEFSKQIRQIQDRATVLALKKSTGGCAHTLTKGCLMSHSW